MVTLFGRYLGHRFAMLVSSTPQDSISMTMDWKDVIEHFVGDHAQNRDRNERTVVPYQHTSKGKQSVLAAYKGLMCPRLCFADYS